MANIKTCLLGLTLIIITTFPKDVTAQPASEEQIICRPGQFVVATVMPTIPSRLMEDNCYSPDICEVDLPVTIRIKEIFAARFDDHGKSNADLFRADRDFIVVIPILKNKSTKEFDIRNIGGTAMIPKNMSDKEFYKSIIGKDFIFGFYFLGILDRFSATISSMGMRQEIETTLRKNIFHLPCATLLPSR